MTDHSHDNRPGPWRPDRPPELADYLRAAALDWAEAQGWPDCPVATIEAAFRAGFARALEDVLEAGTRLDPTPRKDPSQ